MNTIRIAPSILSADLGRLAAQVELVVAGGVSANKQLRVGLMGLMNEVDGKAYFPRAEFCTDNGAMIAYAGYLRIEAGQSESLNFQAKPRWPIETL